MDCGPAAARRPSLSSALERRGPHLLGARGGMGDGGGGGGGSPTRAGGLPEKAAGCAEHAAVRSRAPATPGGRARGASTAPPRGPAARARCATRRPRTRAAAAGGRARACAGCRGQGVEGAEGTRLRRRQGGTARSQRVQRVPRGGRGHGRGPSSRQRGTQQWAASSGHPGMRGREAGSTRLPDSCAICKAEAASSRESRLAVATAAAAAAAAAPRGASSAKPACWASTSSSPLSSSLRG